MKIYKIANPIPYEEDVPFSFKRGRTLLDKLIPDSDKKRIEQKIKEWGYKGFHGVGANGIAFLTSNNKVVKITSDQSEYENAKKQIRLKSPYLVNIYGTAKINESVFMIVMDQLNQLSEHEIKIYNFIFLNYNQWNKWNDVDSKVRELLTKYESDPIQFEIDDSKKFIEFLSFNMKNYKFIKECIIFIKEIRDLGLIRDAHHKNIGKNKKNQLQLFDLGK